jgi:ABC-type sugar transport system ATPase subunit
MLSLALKGINKRFGNVEVLDDIDLDVEQGEFVVFVGPSGCGKSTLLRIIAGLEETTGGDIAIEGRPVNRVDAADRGVAMVFQSYALYPHMTVRQNLSFGLQNINMPKPEIERRVQSAAQLLQIEQYLGRRPKELSGGQRQRVAIGRAITRDPKIFLFDEPLSNLDAELRVQMRAEIGKLHERLGNTMIYVTHDQVEAMTMADKIVVLRKGRVEQVGAPLTLYNTPANKFVAGFIGSPRMNFVEGRAGAVTPTSIEFVADGVPPVTLRASNPAVTPGSRLSLGIRAEDIVLGGVCQAEVDMIELYGASSYLHCHLTGDAPLLVHEAGQSKVRKGDTVSVQFPPGKCHLFDETERALPAGAALEEVA